MSIEHLQKIKTIINETKPLYENIPMEALLIEDGEKNHRLPLRVLLVNIQKVDSSTLL